MTADGVNAQSGTREGRSAGTRDPSWWTLRRLLALAIAAIILVGVLATYVEAFNVCRDEASAAGDVVRICGPVSIADMPAIGVALAIVLLLMLPDLSEIGLAGFSLRSTVARQEEETERLRGDLQIVEARLLFPRSLQRVAQAVQDKLESGGIAPEPDDLPQIADWHAAREKRIDAIRLLHRRVEWAALQAARETHDASGLLTPEQLVATKHWAMEFAEEIADLRIAISAIGFDERRFDEEDLRSLEIIGSRLLWALQNLGVSPPSRPPPLVEQ